MDRLDELKEMTKPKPPYTEEEHIASLRNIEKYKKEIKKLQPRINKLFDVGDECLKLGIRSEKYYYHGREALYDGASAFISKPASNGKLFFILSKCYLFIQHSTDGKCVITVDRERVQTTGYQGFEEALKLFIDGFDDFEANFYKFVDEEIAKRKEDAE